MQPSTPFELLAPVDDPKEHDAETFRAALAECEPPPAAGDFKLAAPLYKPDPDLRTAVNMAIAVAAPLLLTGDPGTGKTQLAHHLSWYFGIPIFEYVVRSDSSAADIKYDFDAVAYLRAAQAKEQCKDKQTHQLRPCRRGDFLVDRPLWRAFDHHGDCVLLIDEIDKAPRDFPNDLLQELDKHEFAHPFDPDHKVRNRGKRPPMVVITSNAERRLPDAFLRRCIWHHIDLTEELVRLAVESRMPSDFPGLAAKPQLRKAARARFWALHRIETLRKKPSTAELLAWLCILHARGTEAEELNVASWKQLPGLSALIKDRDDYLTLAELGRP